MPAIIGVQDCMLICSGRYMMILRSKRKFVLTSSSAKERLFKSAYMYSFSLIINLPRV